MSLDVDSDLLASSCQTLLASVFGRSNWRRWQEVRRQLEEQEGRMDFQTLMSWVLDVVEGQIQAQAHQDQLTTHDEAQSADDYDCGMYQPEPDQISGYDYGAAIDVKANPPMYVGYGRDDAAGSVQPSTSRVKLEPGVGAEEAGGDQMSMISYEARSQTFYCQVCQVSLSDVDVVSQHLTLRHHAATDLSISCSCCQETFLSIPQFVSHHAAKTRLQSSSTKNKHVCSLCARVFPTPKSLEEHVWYKHENGEPKYSCDACGKKFKYSRHIGGHRKTCSAVTMMAP